MNHMNPKYKQYLEAAEMFRTTTSDNEALDTKCKSYLSKFFANDQPSFDRGVFIGKSVIDELDAKHALEAIFEAVLDEEASHLKALLASDKLDKTTVVKLHAMLAGYISSLLK